MASEIVLAPEAIPDLLKLASSLNHWLQALGGLFAFVILSNIINIILNRKKLKKIIEMQHKIDKVEKHLDKILNRRK